MKQKTTHLIGLMSGTSLDGLDVAHCTFTFSNKQWKYQINKAKTFIYPTEIIKLLQSCPQLSGIELLKAHNTYGQILGNYVNQFLREFTLEAQYIASHGHTIFHQPNEKITFQLGSGHEIAASTGLPVIADFRSRDVALAGQGAPLVPIGDKLLFDSYDACINLGGFSNITLLNQDKVIAFDICPVNIVLNILSRKLDKPFDENGSIARSGSVNKALLQQFNSRPYYNLSAPKSLGFEWVHKEILPIITNSTDNTSNLLATFNQHISDQICQVLANYNCKKVLLTGGGTHNTFLIENLETKSGTTLHIPSKLIVDFKEALIFAFLGVCYLNQQTNTLSSVTGARHDSIGGLLYGI